MDGWPVLMLILVGAGCVPFIPGDVHECNVEGSCDSGDPDTDTDTAVVVGPLDACDGDAPGATAWLRGELTVEDPEVTGLEQLLVFPNDAWAAEGGVGCSHDFDVAGRATEALQLDVTLYRLGDSSCDRSEVFVLEEYAWVYRIEPEAGDGATVFYADGAMVGAGTWDGRALEYLSEPYCTRL